MVFASPTLLVVERTCLSNCCLCTRNQSMWDFEWSITSGVSVSWSFLSSPTCLQTRHSWDWSSQCRRTLLGMGDGGAQCGSQTPHSLGRTSAAVLIVSLVGCLTGIWVLTRLLLLPVLLCFLLYILSCGKLFLLVFRLFSSIVFL